MHGAHHRTHTQKPRSPKKGKRSPQKKVCNCGTVFLSDYVPTVCVFVVFMPVILFWFAVCLVMAFADWDGSICGNSILGGWAFLWRLFSLWCVVHCIRLCSNSNREMGHKTPTLCFVAQHHPSDGPRGRGRRRRRRMRMTTTRRRSAQGTRWGHCFVYNYIYNCLFVYFCCNLSLQIRDR